MTIQNNSGRVPFGTRVMLKMKKEPKELKTKLGIIIKTEDGLDPAKNNSWVSRQMNVVVGQIVQMGCKAFYDQGDDSPKLGDWIICKRHAGIHIEGIDDGAYRNVIDMDIHTITINGDDVEVI